MKHINSKNAPAAIGPYSHAVISGALVFTSGQIPLSPETAEIAGSDIAEQTRQVMKNLSAVLEAAGSSMDRVVKTTCFLSDMGDFAGFNEIYGEYLKMNPARSCVAVKTLPKNVLVEVEAVAEIG